MQLICGRCSRSHCTVSASPPPPLPTCQWPALCMFHGVNSSQLWGSSWHLWGPCAFLLQGVCVCRGGLFLLVTQQNSVLGVVGEGELYRNSICMPLRRSPLCKEVLCGGAPRAVSTGHVATPGLPGKWGRKRGSLFKKQSIFIHLYLLNEKRFSAVPLLWWTLIAVK